MVIIRAVLCFFPVVLPMGCVLWTKGVDEGRRGSPFLCLFSELQFLKHIPSKKKSPSVVREEIRVLRAAADRPRNSAVAKAGAGGTPKRGTNPRTGEFIHLMLFRAA